MNGSLSILSCDPDRRLEGKHFDGLCYSWLRSFHSALMCLLPEMARIQKKTAKAGQKDTKVGQCTV
jgi:hypothetical protein